MLTLLAGWYSKISSSLFGNHEGVPKQTRPHGFSFLQSKLLLSGKNHEAFQKQHFPGQPLIPFQGGGLVKQENQ
jgi:hypothetical protein